MAFVGMMKELGEGRFTADESVVAASEDAAWSLLSPPTQEKP